MAVNTRNILVGHGDLYYAPLGTALPTVASGVDSLRTPFEDSNDWNHVGGTMDGVEMSYTPEYGEVMVDQLKGVAKMWNQSNEVQVTTNLAEATFFNMLLALGLDDSYFADGDQSVFSLGVPQDEVVERSIVVVGQGSPVNTGSESEPEWTPRERVYLARRVISVEGSTINMSRTDPTTLAVTFRLLPFPGDNNEHKNSQYGFIVDRTLDEADAMPSSTSGSGLPGPYSEPGSE